MTVLFFVPLVAISVFEAELDPSKNKWVKDWLANPDQGMDDSPEARDPEVDGVDADRLTISRVPFEELVKVFPDTTHVRPPWLSCAWIVWLTRICSRASPSYWMK